MNTELASVDDLSNYRRPHFIKRAKHSILDLGTDKIDACSAENEELINAELSKRRSLLYEKFSRRKVLRLGDLCRVDYTSDEQVLTLSKKTGRAYRFMGTPDTRDKSATLLYPEEALFLVDSGSAEIYCDKLPIGFTCALARFTSELGLRLNQYTVYNNLIKSGYIVRRHQETNRLLNSKETCLSSPLDDGRQLYPDNHQIQFPDDKCQTRLTLTRPDPSLLPINTVFSADRLVWDRSYEDDKPCYTSFLNYNRSFIDNKRREERRVFFKPRYWRVISMINVRNWNDYRQSRKSLAIDRKEKNTVDSQVTNLQSLIINDFVQFFVFNQKFI